MGGDRMTPKIRCVYYCTVFLLLIYPVFSALRYKEYGLFWVLLGIMIWTLGLLLHETTTN